MIIGYNRVSRADQSLNPQTDPQTDLGCEKSLNRCGKDSAELQSYAEGIENRVNEMQKRKDMIEESFRIYYEK